MQPTRNNTPTQTDPPPGRGPHRKSSSRGRGEPSKELEVKEHTTHAQALPPVLAAAGIFSVISGFGWPHRKVGRDLCTQPAPCLTAALPAPITNTDRYFVSGG